MPRYIDSNPWFTEMEIMDFYENHPRGFDVLDAYDIVVSQLDTDDLVEDNFQDALVIDALDGEFPHELLSETLDLCDIVEAVEAGYIIYE